MYRTRVQNAYKRTQLACLLGTRALVITNSSLLRQLVANSLGDARNQSAGDLIQVRCSTITRLGVRATGTAKNTA